MVIMDTCIMNWCIAVCGPIQHLYFLQHQVRAIWLWSGLPTYITWMSLNCIVM